jgi:hypothetical protein
MAMKKWNIMVSMFALALAGSLLCSCGRSAAVTEKAETAADTETVATTEPVTETETEVETETVTETAAEETGDGSNVIQIAKSDFLVYDIELDKTQTNMTSSRVYG